MAVSTGQIDITHDIRSSLCKKRSAPQESIQPRSHTGWIAELALPDGPHPPASPPKPVRSPSIPYLIRFELLKPEFDPCLGHVCETAVSMPVPEAPVDKDCSIMAGQDYVRRSWKIVIPQCETVPHTVQQRSRLPFRTRVRSTDLGHQPTAIRFAEGIDHAAILSRLSQPQYLCNNNGVAVTSSQSSTNIPTQTSVSLIDRHHGM